MVGIEFGAHMVNCVDATRITLDYTGLFASLCAAINVLTNSSTFTIANKCHWENWPRQGGCSIRSQDLASSRVLWPRLMWCQQHKRARTIDALRKHRRLEDVENEADRLLRKTGNDPTAGSLVVVECALSSDGRCKHLIVLHH